MPLKSDDFYPFLMLSFLILAVLPISLLAMPLPMVPMVQKLLYWTFLYGKLFCSSVPWKVMTSIASWSRILELRKGHLILLLVILFDLRWRSPPEQSSGLESSFFKGPTIYLWPSWQFHQRFKGRKRTNLWDRKENCCYHNCNLGWIWKCFPLDTFKGPSEHQSQSGFTMTSMTFFSTLTFCFIIFF